jgi:hypothetical protein
MRRATPTAEHLPAPDELSERLRARFVQSFRTAAHTDVVESSALQASVCAFVRAAKARGEPPQRVIVALKRLTTAGVDDWFRVNREQQRLRDSIIRWCLDEYYGPATDGAIPPPS